MTKSILTIAARAAAVVVFAGAAHVATAQHVEAGVFSISLPEGYAAFTKQEQSVPSPDGEIKATNWISKSPTGEAVVVTMSRMPGKILSPGAMIDSTRDSLLKSLNATLESEKKADTANESLLFFRSAGAVFESRLVVEDDRLFQVLYVGRSDEQRTAPAVTQLFESFSIAKAEAPVEPAPAAAPVTPPAETSGQ
jgi:hypothetical protein